MKCPKSTFGRRTLSTTPSLLFWHNLILRGPAAILAHCVMLLAIASKNLLVLVFLGEGGGVHCTSMAGYVAEWGIALIRLRTSMYQGGGYHTLLGSARLTEKALRDTGYCSDSIAISRNMGQPSTALKSLW